MPPFDREAHAAQQRLIWRDRHEIVRLELTTQSQSRRNPSTPRLN